MTIVVLGIDLGKNSCAGGLAVPEIKAALEAGELFRAHAFELACARADIEHRLTKPNHPWTNGQAERMNRTLKEPCCTRLSDRSTGADHRVSRN